jgi:hypothetical protein
MTALLHSLSWQSHHQLLIHFEQFRVLLSGPIGLRLLMEFIHHSLQCRWHSILVQASFAGCLYEKQTSCFLFSHKRALHSPNSIHC